MFNAKRFGTPGICVGVEANCWPRTSSRLDAGSVLTSKTRRPRSARAMAEAQARDVFPTPPLPVKKRKREGASGKALKESAGLRSVSAFVVLVVIKCFILGEPWWRRAQADDGRQFWGA